MSLFNLESISNACGFSNTLVWICQKDDVLTQMQRCRPLYSAKEEARAILPDNFSNKVVYGLVSEILLDLLAIQNTSVLLAILRMSYPSEWRVRQCVPH